MENFWLVISSITKFSAIVFEAISGLWFKNRKACTNIYQMFVGVHDQKVVFGVNEKQKSYRNMCSKKLSLGF